MRITFVVGSRTEMFVYELLRVPLEPCEQLVEASRMLYLRFGRVSLACADEYNNINPSLG